MFSITAIALLLSIGFALYRLLKGPSIFDRIVSANSIGTLSVLLLAIVGYVFGRPEFIDLAIIYALLNVIGTIAILKYFRHGDLGKTDDEMK